MRKGILLAAAALVLLAACSKSAGKAEETSDGGGPLVAGGGLASCAFEFNLDTLAEREFAFEGTVNGIREPITVDAPYEVEFAIAHWYKDGEGSSATLRTYDVSGTSLAGDIGLEVGQRVLASGDEDFLWGCGFSMTYSEGDAALFD